MDVLMTRECLTDVKRYLMLFAASEASSKTYRTVYGTINTIFYPDRGPNRQTGLISCESGPIV